jgi:phospholipid-translocating ATPase
MESSGEEGRVMVSNETKRMVERSDSHPFKFIKHKDVELSKFNMIVPAFLVEESTEKNKKKKKKT